MTTSMLGRPRAFGDPVLGDDVSWCRLLLDLATRPDHHATAHAELVDAPATSSLHPHQLVAYLTGPHLTRDEARTLIGSHPWPQVTVDVFTRHLSFDDAIVLLANRHLDPDQHRAVWAALSRRSRAGLKRSLHTITRGVTLDLPADVWAALATLAPGHLLDDLWWRMPTDVLVWRLTTLDQAPPEHTLTWLLLREDVTDRHRQILRRLVHRHQVTPTPLLRDLLAGADAPTLLRDSRHRVQRRDILSRLEIPTLTVLLHDQLDHADAYDPDAVWSTLMAAAPIGGGPHPHRDLWRQLLRRWATGAATRTLTGVADDDSVRPACTHPDVTAELTARAYRGDVEARTWLVRSTPTDVDDDVPADLLADWALRDCRWSDVSDSSTGQLVWRTTLLAVWHTGGVAAAEELTAVVAGHTGPLAGLVTALDAAAA